jgi:hypothetical protein
MITRSNSPLQGAGCPFKSTVFYFPPCPSPSCPTYEPNSNDGEYSQPFRHIQYKRTASLRPIATLAHRQANVSTPQSTRAEGADVVMQSNVGTVALDAYRSRYLTLEDLGD